MLNDNILNLFNHFSLLLNFQKTIKSRISQKLSNRIVSFQQRKQLLLQTLDNLIDFTILKQRLIPQEILDAQRIQLNRPLYVMMKKYELFLNNNDSKTRNFSLVFLTHGHPLLEMLYFFVKKCVDVFLGHALRQAFLRSLQFCCFCQLQCYEGWWCGTAIMLISLRYQAQP